MELLKRRRPRHNPPPAGWQGVWTRTREPDETEPGFASTAWKAFRLLSSVFDTMLWHAPFRFTRPLVLGLRRSSK